MSPPLKTNPAYAHLAYQKAITTRVITFLRRNFIGDELTDPREILVCEDVFQQDQKVPQEEVMHFIQRLVEKNAQLDVELKRFQLVAPTQQQGRHEQRATKGPGKPNQKGNQGNGQTRRH